jgi:hypothetical protein
MWFVIVISSFQVWWACLFSLLEGVASWYGVYGSPAVCRYREPIAFKSFVP